MFNFKNKYVPRKKWDPNDPSTHANKGLAGLSKYWRYTTLDAQNSNNDYNYNKNFISQNNGNFNNSYNYPSEENFTSPNDITLEISYDNFYALGVDMMKKKKYAEELRKQIEEKQMIKNLERQKKKLDDLNEDIRIEKERKIIEDRQREENKRYLPKININTPYFPKPKILQEPIKLYTPPPPPPPLPFPSVNPFKTTPKPKISADLIRNYSGNNSIDIPKTKYIYRKVSNTQETKNFLKEREEELEKFNEEMKNQLKMLKKDFNSGMKELNDEVESLNNGIGEKNKNMRNLINQKVNELSVDIKNNNNKKLNIQTEHIFNVIRRTKDGKTSVQQFINSPPLGLFNLPFNGSQYISQPLSPFKVGNVNIITDDNFSDELASNSLKLPYINLSHCISYS